MKSVRLFENTNLYKKFCKKKKKKVNKELLSETVRKYAVLYDKSSADFKVDNPSCILYQGVVCTFFFPLFKNITNPHSSIFLHFLFIFFVFFFFELIKIIRASSSSMVFFIISFLWFFFSQQFVFLFKCLSAHAYVSCICVKCELLASASLQN